VPLLSRARRKEIRRTGRRAAIADIERVCGDSCELQSKSFITCVPDPSLPDVPKMSKEHMEHLMDDDAGSDVSIGAPE